MEVIRRTLARWLCGEPTKRDWERYADNLREARGEPRLNGTRR